MKTSKFFLSTLIAAAAMSANAYAEGESIGINFNSGSGSVDGWNNTTGASGTVENLVDMDGESTGASLAYSCNNTWQDGGNTDNVLKGYLDDNNLSVTVSGISYLTYSLTVIAASDEGGGVFRYYTVNNINYYGSEGVGVEGTNTWGSTDTGTVGNDNSFVISNLAGNVSLVSPGRSGSERACLAGLVITNTYAGTATTVTLDGADKTWTTSAIGTDSWTNSTADIGTYAAFNLTANTGISVSDEGITTDAITAAGSGVLNLSGKEITLINAGVVRTDSDSASIVVNNDLRFSSFGSVSGNVTLNGSTVFENGGSLASGVVIGADTSVSVTGGTLSIVETPTSGTISVSEGAVVALATKQSGEVDATNISGAGTFDIGFDNSYSGKINITNTAFTGDVYVSSGNFTINNAKFNDTLRLANGVNFQLTGGSFVEFSKNLVLDGVTQVHQNTQDNVGATLTFTEDSSVSGSGTYDRRGGGTLTFKGVVELGGFTTGASATTTFSGETSLDRLTVTQGTVNISGNSTSIKTLNIAGNGTTTFSSGATIDTISVSGNSANSGSVTVKAGATVSANSMFNGWGLKTLSVDGALNISGNMQYSSGDVLNTITGGGTISVGTFTFGNTGKYQLSGGVTLAIGSGGIQTTNAGWGLHQLRIGDATLSATDDWSVSDSYTSGYIKLNSTENGGAKFDTNGHSITFGSSLEDFSETEIGSLTKKGAGALTLSGNNTYSGGTTVSAGTLVAAHQNALGSGDVSVADNAKLSLGTALVTINNLSGAGDVDLADGTSAATLKINSTKDTSFSGNIGSHVSDNSKVFSLIKEGSGTFALAEGLIENLSVNAGTFVTNPGIYADSVSVSSGATLKVVPVGIATYAGSFEFASGAQLRVDLGNLAVPADANANNAVIAVDVIAAEVIKFGDLTLSEGDSITLPENFVTVVTSEALSKYINQTWSYNGGVLSLTLAIPEPSLFGLLAGLGALTLVGTRRRRSKTA